MVTIVKLLRNAPVNVTGNEKLCSLHLKKLFLKRFKFLLILFIDAITPINSSTQIAYDVICVQHVIQ